MPIRRIYRKKFHGVILKSGYIYSFKYSSWRNDPKPTIILMYSLEGNHPNTGHQWRFLQGINLSYLPRSMRRAFANEWVRVFERTNGNVRFTFAQPKQTLELFRRLCAGKSTPYKELCELFDKETKTGDDMEKYNDLLSKAVSSIESVFKKRVTAGLQSGRDFVIPDIENQANSQEDFELISWLVIKENN